MEATIWILVALTCVLGFMLAVAVWNVHELLKRISAFREERDDAIAERDCARRNRDAMYADCTEKLAKAREALQ